MAPDRKRIYRRDMLLAGVMVAAGVAMSGCPQPSCCTHAISRWRRQRSRCSRPPARKQNRRRLPSQQNDRQAAGDGSAGARASGCGGAKGGRHAGPCPASGRENGHTDQATGRLFPNARRPSSSSAPSRVSKGSAASRHGSRRVAARRSFRHRGRWYFIEVVFY